MSAAWGAVCGVCGRPAASSAFCPLTGRPHHAGTPPTAAHGWGSAAPRSSSAALPAPQVPFRSASTPCTPCDGPGAVPLPAAPVVHGYVYTPQRTACPPAAANWQQWRRSEPRDAPRASWAAPASEVLLPVRHEEAGVAPCTRSSSSSSSASTLSYTEHTVSARRGFECVPYMAAPVSTAAPGGRVADADESLTRFCGALAALTSAHPPTPAAKASTPLRSPCSPTFNEELLRLGRAAGAVEAALASVPAP